MSDRPAAVHFAVSRESVKKIMVFSVPPSDLYATELND